jgi:hypothetical protein
MLLLLLTLLLFWKYISQIGERNAVLIHFETNDILIKIILVILLRLLQNIFHLFVVVLALEPLLLLISVRKFYP